MYTNKLKIRMKWERKDSRTKGERGRGRGARDRGVAYGGCGDDQRLRGVAMACGGVQLQAIDPIWFLERSNCGWRIIFVGPDVSTIKSLNLRSNKSSPAIMSSISHEPFLASKTNEFQPKSQLCNRLTIYRQPIKTHSKPFCTQIFTNPCHTKEFSPQTQ